MSQKKRFKYWIPLALILLELAAIEYFVLTWLQMDLGNFLGGLKFGDHFVVGVKFLAFFLGFLVLEFFFVLKSHPKNKKSFLIPLLLTHLPWLFGFLLPVVVSMTFPAPHNGLDRKADVLFGLMVVTHLFLFCGWFLWRARNNGWKVSTNFGLVALFFFITTTLFTTQCDLSGDEPHYLLMAYSLIHDGDLDLTNNYQKQDYKEFYHRGILEPQGLDHITVSSLYSYHPLGPVLLVLPGFKLAGRLGASLTMALLAALTLFLTLKVLEETGAKGWSLQAIGAIGLFSSPLLLFAGLIYPEIPTACLIALSLWLFLRKRWGWLGLCQGLLLWMHNRNVLLVIPFLLITLYEIQKREFGWPEKAGKLVVGFVPLVIALVGYFFYLYGVVTPLGAHNEPFTSLFPLHRFFTGFLGLVLDQECGLWFHFPVFAVMVTGGVLLAHSRDPLKLLILGTVGFFYFFMSFYENLGLTPATRYMVGITPLLLIGIYPALEKMRKWDHWAIFTAFSFAAGVLVNWVLAAIPWMRYNQLQGQNWMLKIAGGFIHLPLADWEPSFQAPEIQMKSYLLSAFWVLGSIVLTALFIKDEKKAKR